MPVTVVVGGQFGSEGKGKVCAHLAKADDAAFVVRCGGPNSGHTVDHNGKRFELKQVPAGFVNPRTRLLIAAGALIKPALLLSEIALCSLEPDRIGVDYRAGVIDEEDVVAESSSGLRERLGSTGVGMGSAVSRRALRAPGFRTAADVPELREYLTDVAAELSPAAQQAKRVIVEGTQGFGLSLYHRAHWPFCTSRDTTAHSFLGEVGIGVRDFDVVMAIRTFPIRVGGNSGPLPTEITWSELQKRSGYPHSIEEYTTTTKRLRRVAAFDWEVVRRAAAANRPTHIALHGADYVHYRNTFARDFNELSPDVKSLIVDLERECGAPVTFVGTGPSTEALIDRRSSVTTTSSAVA